MILVGRGGGETIKEITGLRNINTTTNREERVSSKRKWERKNSPGHAKRDLSSNSAKGGKLRGGAFLEATWRRSRAPKRDRYREMMGKRFMGKRSRARVEGRCR